MTKGDIAVVLGRREAELIKRPQADVNVTVLEKLIVEAFLGEISVKGYQGAVFLRGVSERSLLAGGFRPIFPDLPLCGVIVLFGRLGPPEHILHIGAVQIRLGEVRIQLDRLVIVVQSVHPPTHLDKVRGSVIIGQNVVRIDVNDTVHVGQGVLEITHLGADETPVVKGQGVTRFLPENPVEIRHGGVIVVGLVEHQGPVEIGEGICRVQGYCLIHIGDSALVVLLKGINPAPPDVSFRIEAVKRYGLVVIRESLGRVSKEQI